MNDESTNRDPAEVASLGPPEMDQPIAGGPVNPYLSPQVELPSPPPPKPGYQANLVDDLALAAVVMMLNVVGAAVMVPFVMLFSQGNPQVPQLPWIVWLAIQLAMYSFMAAITIPIGVWLGSRVGLDAPVLRGITKGDFSLLNPLRAGWVAASIGGIAGGSAIYLSSLALPHDVMGENLNQETVKGITSAPSWIPALASIGAGITEETWCRYGIMAFIVWFGCLLANSDRPHTAYLWFANIAASLPFSAMHIGNLLVLGGEISPESLAVIFGYNGLIAVICGWLYWKYGIESAMACHASCDIAMKVVWPLILPT